jgi:predicted transcriptional regulator of viral defense system
MAHKYGMESRRLTWNPNYKGIDDWQLAVKMKLTQKEGGGLNWQTQKINDLCDANNGIVKAADVRAAGVSPFYLSQMVSDGRLNRLARGLYAVPDTYVDEMYELYSKNSYLIFSHLSALYMHDLTDRTPSKMWVTVPRTNNVSKLLSMGLVEVKRSNPDTHRMGQIEMRSPSGFPIPVYDMERTICDIVKARKHTDPQILSDALNGYVRRKDNNLPMLAEYARALKTEEAVRQYIEVLL